MDTNNYSPSDEISPADAAPRCGAVTRKGAPCKNLAIADGRCWVHGGRRKAVSADDNTLFMAEPVLAEAPAPAGQQAPEGDSSPFEKDLEPEEETPADFQIDPGDIEIVSDQSAEPGPLESSIPIDPGLDDLGVEIEIGPDENTKGEEIEPGIALETDALELSGGELPEEGQEKIGAKPEDLQLEIIPDEETAPQEGQAGIEIDPGDLELVADQSRDPEPPEPAEGQAAEPEDLHLEIIPDEGPPPQESEAGIEIDPEDLELMVEEGRDPEPPEPAEGQAAEPEELDLEIIPDIDEIDEKTAPEFEIKPADLTLAADEKPESGPPGLEDSDIVLEMEPSAAPGPNESEPDQEIGPYGPEVSDQPEAISISPDGAEPEMRDDWLDVEAIRTAAEKTGPGPTGKLDAAESGLAAVKKPETFWRKKIGIPAPIFFLGLLLAISLLTLYILNDSFGIRAPYVSDLLRLRSKDAGNMKLTVFGLNSKFVQNSTAGSLLVITGRVKNDYASPRGFISISGKLYTRKNFVKTQTVYCGNLLSDEDLAELPSRAIQKRLSNRSGDRGSNERVASRKTLPFMIVFSQLPDDLESLERFTVEATRSFPVR